MSDADQAEHGSGEASPPRSPERRLAEQTALYRFTDRLYRAESETDVYDAALDAILAALGCDRASILLFDAQGVMSFVAHRGLSEVYRAAVNGHSPWEPGDRDPEPIFLRDIRDCAESQALKRTIEGEGIRGLAFIPLVARGYVIGKFMTYYGDPHDTSPEEAELALTIARQLGFAIERRRNDEALRRNDERLRLATQAGKVGLWDWDIAANRIAWTESIYSMHGMRHDEFSATFEDWIARVHPADRDRVETSIARALSGEAPYEMEMRSMRPDGGVTWIFTSANIARENGKAVRMVGASVDITQRKQMEHQRDLLVAELSHRVKNTLATVISIARQSFTKSRSAEEARQSFDGRIQALAQTHGRLAESNWAGVPFETIVLDELKPYRREDGSNVRIWGPHITFNPKSAVVLGMALHELATNAAKYGALSTKTGIVDVNWALKSPNRGLVVTWKEKGGPAVTPPERSGFGRVMIERALTSDLQGKVALAFEPEGLKCVIELPRESLSIG
jgi:PAS domain S-box-containing protein